MTLKDQMADDADAIFLNTDEFADDATFTPKGEAAGFACKVVMGDPQPGYVQIDGGQEDRRAAVAMLSRATVRDGIFAMCGNDRDPIKGDTLTVDSGAYAGAWFVSSSQGDDGGMIAANVVWAKLATVGNKTTREVR